MEGRFGRRRYLPPGEWVQATPLLEVYGIQHRRRQAHAFCSAVSVAERAGRPYGVRLECEPRNRHDPNAIKVIGICMVKQWFRAPRERSWHVGYVQREVAADTHSSLLARDIPIEAELYSIYRSADFIDIKFFILAPPGNSASTRQRHAR